MTDYSGILVCGELVDGKISSTTRELITAGRKLSNDLGQSLSALIIGDNIQDKANEIITLGADRVYVAKGLNFIDASSEVYVAIITEACKTANPSIILMGQNDIGREVAPRLAAKLGAAVALDCTELAIDAATKRLLQTKPVYGGNAMAVWTSASDKLQIVTLRPRSVAPAVPDTNRKGEITALNISVDMSKLKCRLLETVREEVKGIKLEDAKTIVCGGGGIGNKDGFKLLEELAKILGGTIAVTRVPCDQGWMPISLEIGQTGRIVSPGLYIGIGVSGAPQHMAGCSGSKCIVAINRDAEAHIFKEADFGVVGEYAQVLPSLIEKCKSLISG
jgi:caffeyl-CoA reductase-Etf complex subunit CarE